jgi:hypothetical protein
MTVSSIRGSIFCRLQLNISEHPRRSRRATKGQRAAPPDADIMSSVSPQRKGKKRAVEEVVPPSDDDEHGENTSTPTKPIGAPAAPPRFQYRVQSPPESRPKQRQRVNSDGEAANASSDDVEELNTDTLWVGEGDVSISWCFTVVLTA